MLYPPSQEVKNLYVSADSAHKTSVIKLQGLICEAPF